ncbi:MAG TPA: NAD(P)/FAD-dependent oxidoreductase [Puia sp.]|nr:NAD(P)/FAD-dependent oxidoreductase [Puia sp.]
MQSDVVIIGAGIAGSTAALLFARQNIRVAVIEKKQRVSDYKKLCTHFIQPSALPVIKRLQLDSAIEMAGGLPNKADIWTKAGWIRSGDEYHYGEGMQHGYNIERRILDPLLRNLLCNEPGIQYIPGSTVKEIHTSSPQAHRISYLNNSGQHMELEARLVVAADGRFSEMATLLDNEGSVLLNNRFVCFAYFRHVALSSGGHSQFWTLDPDMAFAYPLQKDITLICLFIKKTEWQSWKKQLEKNFISYINNLHDGPGMEKATRISNIHCMLEMPNITRPAVKNGVAFIGDAALALDPMSGVGCGFAFQSAEWLVDHTCKALLDHNDLDSALQSYKEYHEARLLPHAAGIHADSLAESDDGSKLQLYNEIVQDPELTDAFLALTGRIITPQAFFALYLKKKLRKRKQPIYPDQQ